MEPTLPPVKEMSHEELLVQVFHGHASECAAFPYFDSVLIRTKTGEFAFNFSRN